MGNVGKIRFWWMISLLGVTCIMLGIAMLYNPKSSFVDLSPIFGTIFFASGLTSLLNFLRQKQVGRRNRWVVWFSIVTDTVLGVCVLFVSNLPIQYPIMIFCAWLLACGIVSLYVGILMRKRAHNTAVTIIVSGCLFVLSSLFTVFFSGQCPLSCMGATMIVSGTAMLTISVQVRRLITE